MTNRTLWFACTLIVTTATILRADDVPAKYIGENSCSAQFWGPIGNFGIRLDKTQKAYLAAHTVAGRKLLMIVQYQKEGDQCGVVKDVIESSHPDTYFEFECVDQSAPSAVAIGTWPARSNSKSGPAVQAWRIDLIKLEFVPDSQRVLCTRRSYSSVDQGEDLAGWARARTTKKHPHAKDEK